MKKFVSQLDSLENFIKFNKRCKVLYFMYEIKTKELGNKKNKNIRSENLFVTQVHMDSK